MFGTSNVGLRQRRLGGLRATGLVGVAGTALVLGGCNVDSYMDPSVVGRWEETPVKAPIMDRFTSLEGPANEGIETSKVRPEDLIPEPEAYRAGPGDALEMTIENFYRDNVPLRLEQLEIDQRGFVDLPQIGSIFLYGQTVDQMVQSVKKALADAKIINDATVSVIVRGRRKLTYNIIGDVSTPGTFNITKPDFRVMDALSAAGRFNQQIETIYLIRTIPLSDRVTGRPTNMTPSASPAKPMGAATTPSAPTTPVTDPAKKPSVVDIIDDLSKPVAKPAPAMMRAVTLDEPRKPVVDVIDAQSGKAAVTPVAVTTAGEASTWAFVNGQWVQNGGSRNTASPVMPDGSPNKAPLPIGERPTPNGEQGVTELITQRVIEIPMKALLAGSAQFNVVIRPGDYIRVPTQSEGVFYVQGQVARPGPYQLPANGKMTLTRAIVSSGGLASTAIPERVDLTRLVGPDQQVTVRLNLRAIERGTHPDVVIKPDDKINVGTNAFAYPLAVLRNGLRASYGFGFILDRNFGFDIFGPQRTNGL